jgi:hypothetical protein
VITVKIIIACYPDFTAGTTWAPRASLRRMGGDRLLEVMHSNTATERHGYGFDCGDIRYIVYPSSHCYLSMARNNAIQTWSGSRKKYQIIDDCDGVLCIDADHSWEPEQVERLVLAGKPIIAAAYRLRTDKPPECDCYEAGYFDLATGAMGSRVHKSEVGIRRVDWIGGGFVYIRTAALAQMEYPWFRRGVFDCGDEALEMGEDVGLCKQAQKIGIPVFVDCDNVVGHGR